METLEEIISNAWERRKEFNFEFCPHNIKEAIAETMSALDKGRIRIAENHNGKWQVNTWLKKAVILYLRVSPSKMMGSAGDLFWDKVPLKFSNWLEEDFLKAGIRVVPGSKVRYGSYIEENSVLMPSFINIGARIGAGSMIDTWATVGSCAQIGANVHISGGVGIGGVMEPIQASPVIIEDDCFIGARSEIAEGVIVKKGAVISMGVFLGASTKIYDRQNDKVYFGEVPPYSVVVPGVMPSKNAFLGCAVIVKTVDEKTRSRTGINELLRDL